ncbi:hypothetical protein Ct61P_15469 [Colletotrichum tofieldiae]|nr:hypothetical protein Ct61P_15469 [Colletotrichum tofieldiae]
MSCSASLPSVDVGSSPIFEFANRDKYMRHLINSYPGCEGTVKQTRKCLMAIFYYREIDMDSTMNGLCLCCSDLHYLEWDFGLHYFQDLGLGFGNAALVVDDILNAVYAYRNAAVRAHLRDPEHFKHPDPNYKEPSCWSTTLVSVVVLFFVIYITFFIATKQRRQE